MAHRPRPHTPLLPSFRVVTSLAAAGLLAGCAEGPMAEDLPSLRNAASFDYFSDCPSTANLAAGQPYQLEPPPTNLSDTNLSTEGDASQLTACEPGQWDVSRTKHSVTWNARPSARVTVELPNAAACAATQCEPSDDSGTCNQAACAGVDDVVLQLFTNPKVGSPCPDEVVFETSADGVSFVEIAHLEGSAVCAHPGPMGDTGDNTDSLVFASDDPDAVLGSVGAGWVRVTAHHRREHPDHFSFGEVMVMGTSTGAIALAAPDQTSAIADLAGPQGWRAHVVSPWSALDPHAPFPPSPATQLTTPVLPEGTRIRTLAIANASGGPVTLTPAVATPIAAGATFAGTIELAIAVPQTTARFEDRADALVPVGPAGASTITIPNGELGHLLLRVEAGSSAPATYQTTLTLDDGQGHVQLVDLQIPVLPTVLPSARDTVSIHDYPDGDPSCGYDWLDERATYRDAWGVSSVYTMPPGWYDTDADQLVDQAEIDASVQPTLDELLRHPEINRLVIKLRAHNLTYNHAAAIHCFGSPEWAAAYGEWITGFVAAIGSQGFDPADLVFEVVDEAQTSRTADYSWCSTGAKVNRAEVLLTVATAIHAADPSLKIMANPLLPASSATNCQSVDALECLLGQVDIWMPNMEDLDDPLDLVDANPNDRGTFYASRAGLEELWTYNGPPWSNDQRPYDKRLIPWTMFAVGATGYGTWNIHDEATGDPSCDPADPNCSYLVEPVSLSSPWHSLDSVRPDYGTTYRSLTCDPIAPAVADVQTPILASMRQAGLQQGLEDYRVLVALREALDQCAGLPVCANTCVAAAPAEQALEDGWWAVLSDRDDTSLADTVRLDLRQRLGTVRGCLP